MKHSEIVEKGLVSLKETEISMVRDIVRKLTTVGYLHCLIGGVIKNATIIGIDIIKDTLDIDTGTVYRIGDEDIVSKLPLDNLSIFELLEVIRTLENIKKLDDRFKTIEDEQ